jgi:hypothetical protein
VVLLSLILLQNLADRLQYLLHLTECAAQIAAAAAAAAEH